MNWEFAFLDWIQTHLRSAFLDQIMPVITFLGDGGWFWIAVTIPGFFFKSTRKYALAAAIGLVLCLFCGNLILKPLVARVRPYELRTGVEILIPAPKDYSFPSGHTQSSFAVATAVCMWDRRFGIPALILATLIAFSRLYLYVHYPTDVLAGIIFGVGFAFLGLFISSCIFRN